MTTPPPAGAPPTGTPVTGAVGTAVIGGPPVTGTPVTTPPVVGPTGMTTTGAPPVTGTAVTGALAITGVAALAVVMAGADGARLVDQNPPPFCPLICVPVPTTTPLSVLEFAALPVGAVAVVGAGGNGGVTFSSVARTRSFSSMDSPEAGAI